MQGYADKVGYAGLKTEYGLAQSATEPVQSLDTAIASAQFLLDRTAGFVEIAQAMRSRLEGDFPEVGAQAQHSAVTVGGKLGDLLRVLELVGHRFESLGDALSSISARL